MAHCLAHGKWSISDSYYCHCYYYATTRFWWLHWSWLFSHFVVPNKIILEISKLFILWRKGCAQPSWPWAWKSLVLWIHPLEPVLSKKPEFLRQAKLSLLDESLSDIFFIASLVWPLGLYLLGHSVVLVLTSYLSQAGSSKEVWDAFVWNYQLALKG